MITLENKVSEFQECFSEATCVVEGNTSLAALMKENANDDADGETNARTMGRIFPKRHLRCFVRLFMENCVGQ